MCRDAVLKVLLLTCACLAGCATQQAGELSPLPLTPAQSSTLIEATTIGESVEGRPIQCITLGSGDEVVLFIAGIHGNEAAGVPLLERLIDELIEQPEWWRGRRIVIVPDANPDAVAHHRRTNMHGVDVNRNFPAGNHRARPRNGVEPLSEPESAALHELIMREQPVVIVSIHQPIACVDYDGPARELAQAMSQLCGLPVRKLGGRPGSLGSWAGIDRGIAVITLELPGDASKLSGEALWDRYGAALIEVMTKSGTGR